jgi:serine/threonine protein kinase
VILSFAAMDWSSLGSRPSGGTVLLPRAALRASMPGSGTGALAPELLSQSARRLRILALLYAFIFFMAGFFPNLVFADERARFFQNPANWVPGVVSIAVALSMCAFTMSARVPLSVVMNVGLLFEVVSCYGIALAEYLEPTRLNMNGWIGLSWVAVWALLFTVVIPTRPRKAALATLVSVSAVPVVIGFMVATRRTTYRPDGWEFFFWIVLPYLLVTLMAYVGARVVYTLGKAVTEARELGSYRLVERLGHGGMGEVWRARHRLLARPAAIKLIRASGSHDGGNADEAVRRFEREAQVTAGLSSPHTVQLFDFGVADDGSFYYVMELLNGLDLETLVRRHGPVPAERAIYLLRQVCHSLAEAESYGLVHRDIKPANLFVCLYGGEYDFVKVLDFGIAKPASDMMETGAIGLTRDNLLRGTPAYIAPEQVLGESQVDSRADIYATGCVAYFLLTGELVFTADTPMAIVVQHAKTRPTPPSERSELPIPPALDRVVMDCLAKNPGERPQSARELSRRLAEVGGLNPWTEERAREWWETHQPELAPSERGGSEEASEGDGQSRRLRTNRRDHPLQDG